MVTQALEAAGSLAIGVPLLAGWMTIWYLVPLSFVIGCVQCVDLPARQTFMLNLVGGAELRRGTSLYATVTGLARITGRPWPGSSSRPAARPRCSSSTPPRSAA